MSLQLGPDATGPVMEAAGGGGTARHVVVGFDGSPASHDALAFAVGWTRRLHAQLDVVYVPDSTWQALADVGAAMCAIPVVLGTQVLVDFSGPVAEALAGQAIEWTYQARNGPVAATISQRADELGADAIIVGHSRRFRQMLGSPIAHQLLRRTNRIVIVVS